MFTAPFKIRCETTGFFEWAGIIQEKVFILSLFAHGYDTWFDT